MTNTANAPERIWAMTERDERGGRMSTGIFHMKKPAEPDWHFSPPEEYVLSTHCDELVAAAYLDAAQRIEQCLWSQHWYIDGESVDPEDLSEDITSRTPDDARAALTARDERMKADLADAQEKIARLAEALEILRDNPAAVHINMLKGNVARPTWEQIKHLYCAEFKSLQENANG